MNTPIITLILSVFAYVLAVPGQAQQAATSQPSAMQQQPCTTVPGAGKPTTKPPKALTDPNSKIGKIFGKYSPIDPDEILKSNAKPATPCPPTAAPNTQVAPALHFPPGVTTVWACNPIIVSTDAKHTVSLITAEQLTRAEPAQSNTFEADTASSDGNAVLPCANLRRDPKTNKVFLPQ